MARALRVEYRLNPLRAKMATELCSYPFSSYPAFIGQVQAPKWLELNWLLSLFGQSHRSAAKNYRDFVEIFWQHMWRNRDWPA